ncbi:hypothetical protein [Planotetraspora sp. GP83]|uniref:hypothetical protein n=1 Tax=Planotetraspora sp. GP83 TaxID=3156264 RepID=UPI003512F00B
MGWRNAIVRIGAAIATVLTVCCCGTDPAPSAAPPPGLSVSLQQWRSDVPVHRLQVAVRNDTATPVFFQDVRLVSGSFQEMPAQPVNSTLGRTPRTDLPIPYGAARCDPRRIPPVKPAVVLARLRVAGGPLHEVMFAIPHPDPLLGQLLRTECGEFMLRQSIQVAFGDTWTRTGGRLTGGIRILRKGGTAPVTVEDIGGTTHYDLKPASGERRPVAVIPGPSTTWEIPVVVTPSRCDPHAMGEAKQAFLFPVWASVGGAQTYRVIVVPDEPSQRLFQSFATAACGLT